MKMSGKERKKVKKFFFILDQKLYFLVLYFLYKFLIIIKIQKSLKKRDKKCNCKISNIEDNKDNKIKN